MDSLYKYSNYIALLKDIIYSPDTKRGTQVQMAKAMGCQAAYLSQVLKGTAELTEDHALKLSIYLNLSSLEKEYFLILVRISRAGTPELREYLEAQRKDILQRREDISRRINSSAPTLTGAQTQKYFSSWIPSTIHIATSSKELQTLEDLSTRLRLDKAKVMETLLFLQEIGLVENKNSLWEFAKKSIHFPKDSPINTTHQITRRHQVIRSIELERPEDIHYSSVFTLSPKTSKRIKMHLLNFIEQSHSEIESSGTDEIYGLCLDFFEI